MSTILHTHRSDARESAGRTMTTERLTCSNCKREWQAKEFGLTIGGQREHTTCRFCRTETYRCRTCGVVKLIAGFSWRWDPHQQKRTHHTVCRVCYSAARRKPTGPHMRPKGPPGPTITVAQDRKRRQYTYREWRCVMAASRRIGLKDPCANDEVVRLMGDPNIYKYDADGEPVRNNKGTQVALGNVRAQTLRQTQILATALLVAQEAK